MWTLHAHTCTYAHAHAHTQAQTGTHRHTQAHTRTHTRARPQLVRQHDGDAVALKAIPGIAVVGVAIGRCAAGYGPGAIGSCKGGDIGGGYIAYSYAWGMPANMPTGIGIAPCIAPGIAMYGCEIGPTGITGSFVSGGAYGGTIDMDIGTKPGCTGMPSGTAGLLAAL
uniref:Uncharacterized protein n=1 Tax=Coccolithus braarudii TaxID=221442 RepID=A0A7S0LCN8_9EUKA|mmetsp:Transcript_33613/g.71719  ORF Transcript_33613/g.71719 Transcript_33613/m.71719 type:complete len:168 (+) Transcript_33613:450-953(+)